MSQTLAVANGDLDINPVGSCDLITGRDKVAQDIAEALLSDYDRTRNYGGKLQTMSVPGAGAKSLITMELQTILKRLQSLQANDSSITAQERIASVPSIQVQAITATDFTFKVQVTTADAGTVTMTDSVRYRSVQLSHTWPNGVQPIQLQR